MLKVLQQHIESWPNFLTGTLFAHRTAPHSSTKYSPAFIVYNRQIRLPFDPVREFPDSPQENKFNEDKSDKEVFDMAHFHRMLRFADNARKVSEGLRKNFTSR